ncbi:hypothetical protein [Sphingomicrobium flavum]|uniref:hypothetical protein n=1 Tax=Sphingomicrobium flavum TaxID=1229164 RepID=UPI0035E3F3C1
MSEHKAFASLSSGLLARKGDARPAMRRQNFGEMGQDLDDLGWNDMGEDPGASAAAAPSFGGFEDGDDNDRGVLAALGPLAGLSAQKAVQNQIQSVATQAHSVKQQQADIMAHFRIPDDEIADDGADLEDETAELWDPEAEDDGNIFSGHTDSVAESGDEDGAHLRFTADRYASEDGFVPFAEDAGEAEVAEEEFAIDAEVDEPVIEATEEEFVAEDAAAKYDNASDNFAVEAEAPAFEAPVAEVEDDFGKVPFATDVDDEDSSDHVTQIDHFVDPASIDLSSLEDELEDDSLELAEEAGEDAFVAEDEIEVAEVAEEEDEVLDLVEAEEDEILDLVEVDEAEDEILELSDAEEIAESEDDDVLELAAEDEAIEAVEEDEELTSFVAADVTEEAEPFELAASDEMAEAAAADQDFAEAAALKIEPEAEEEISVPTIADIVPMPALRAETIRRPRRPRLSPGDKEKAAFTLRLDKQRHLKLRLASAVTGQSAQKMLIEALDRMLEEMPELEALAEHAPEVGKKAG